MNREAYVLIDVEKGRAADVVIELTDKPGISAAKEIWGPHDVIAVIEADDVDTLIHIVKNEIVAADGVLRTDTCLVITGH
jgi:DNA-binding Lrp family transcriptional regulator